EYFDCDAKAPYMIVNYTVHEDKRRIIPAVTHIDNSSRIQTVSTEDNPVFYMLIDEFGKLTGVPVVLNTSFNLRGYPIVNTPREAVETFCTGGIDFLLLERYILSKRDIANDIQNKFLLTKKID
ncbi:MAG TPA: carbamoyltransferase C-terminal domain-containing protein, partial [candidate division Zixibacteria bacterium]|nr:carbamoyltransferase C-terminal domain-containing protein [candidate division Zixibacteria bacterium]